MRTRILCCTFLIVYGLFILAILGTQHLTAVVTGHLVPFDEDGERVYAPALGTISLCVGLFWLVLGSGRRE